ncbi:MurR/RpiR family transcriptional regulator [Dolosigranulum pigrum]|jgi:phosphosugar-binding transcriptional regulator, rpiR family|uniref:MurR/RpiR family transcriptional regulator n=1 Tax=Dolosigranulum pigrum TaxID=29394 RepID=UPI00242DB6B0|nr:MurR/RpiR family transcriptional regulator [Dolosigranulum pigrum]
MPTIKLIATDMDGTFLNSNKDYDRKRFNRIFQQLQAQDITFVVAKNITQKWIRIGKNILNFDDIHQLMTAMISFSKNASIILVSNSGQTKEILDIAKFAREKSITTIGITQFGDHPLGKLANLNIHTTHTEEAALRSAAISSLHAQFFIVDILFYLFIQKYHDQYIENIQ